MTFLQKSYGEHCKVEKPVLMTMNNGKLDDEEKLKMVPIFNKYNNKNVVSDSDIDDNAKTLKTFLTKISMKLKLPPKPL